MKEAWPIWKRTFGKCRDDGVLGLSAALAYYAIFSIGPLLVIAAGLAGLAFSHEAIRHQTEQQLESIVGESSARMMVSMMAAQKRGAGFITTIAGLLMMMAGAGGMFGQLQDSLNVIWGVKAKPGLRVRDLIRARLLSLSMVLGIGFLLLVSMILTTLLGAMSRSLGSKLGVSAALLHILNFVTLLAVISVLFAMIFKFLPDVKISLRKVWVGAIGTAVLFTTGKSLLVLYLGRASTASVYGAAGSVMVVLLWVYYASLILLLGAEFTQAYARRTGASIGLEKYAVAVSRETSGVKEMPGESGVRAAVPSRPSARLAADRNVQPVADGRSLTGVCHCGGVNPVAPLGAGPWKLLSLMLAVGFAASLLKASRVRKRSARCLHSENAKMVGASPRTTSGNTMLRIDRLDEPFLPWYYKFVRVKAPTPKGVADPRQSEKCPT